MFINKKQLLCSNNLGLEMKKKLITSCIWSVALYGSETWTLGKNEKRVVNELEKNVNTLRTGDANLRF